MLESLVVATLLFIATLTVKAYNLVSESTPHISATKSSAIDITELELLAAELDSFRKSTISDESKGVIRETDPHNLYLSFPFDRDAFLHENKRGRRNNA